MIGSNLFIWYGFTDNRIGNDFIIDATTIKHLMEKDLSCYDHVCVSIDKADDIISLMIELGKRLYATACHHQLFSNLIVENEYGDSVIISNATSLIHKHFIQANGIAKFTCSNVSPFDFFCKDPRHGIISSTLNFSNIDLNKILNQECEDNSFFITDIDDISGTALTYKGGIRDIPQYYSVSCIRQHAHQLIDLQESEKCHNLHGHTYKCWVSVENRQCKRITDEQINKLGTSILYALEASFQIENLRQTTLENIIDYMGQLLSLDYEIAYIELTETPNIKARIYY